MTYPILRALALPVWLGFAALVLMISPALALLARMLGHLSGRPEPVAMVRLLLVYVTGELAVMLAPTRSHERRLLQLTKFLDDLVTSALGSLRVHVELDLDASAQAALARHDRPVMVFSRHAGAGDSVLLVHLLLAHFRREPGIVMKEILTLDPVVGMISRHLPCALIDGADDDPEEIHEVARELGLNGAMLLFPEGGNFTPERRAAAIAWLRRNGHPERAARAARLEHTIAPRPRGVIAALDGARGADVIFTAHTGLGRAASGLRILRELPRDTTVRIRAWHVPAGDLPTSQADRIEWLDEWWARLDSWVAAQGAE